MGVTTTPELIITATNSPSSPVRLSQGPSKGGGRQTRGESTHSRHASTRHNSKTDAAASSSVKVLAQLKIFQNLHPSSIIIGTVFLPFLVLVVLNIVIGLNQPENALGQCDVLVYENFITVDASYVLLVLLPSLFATRLLRGIPDPFHVVTELNINLVCMFIGVVGFSLHELSQIGVIPTAVNFSYWWITWIGFQFGTVCVFSGQLAIAIRGGYQEPGFHSGKRRKKSHQIEQDEEPDAKRSTDEVKKFLQTELNQDIFREFLVTELSGEMLGMYLAAMNWERQYWSAVDNTRRAQAKKICSLYIDVDSVLCVNISYNLRTKLLQTLNSSEHLMDTLFVDVKEEMLHMMIGPYVRFRHLQAKDRAAGKGLGGNVTRTASQHSMVRTASQRSLGRTASQRSIGRPPSQVEMVSPVTRHISLPFPPEKSNTTSTTS